MSKVRAHAFTVSLDGYGAGPNQSVSDPLGVGGQQLHAWAVKTRTFQKVLFNSDSGETGVDDDFTARSFENIGAYILGRNMFGPIRGPWPDDGWKGWWGDDPPYHCDVFVLTHHARNSVTMAGGTTFHFVTDGIESALERAKVAANERDVRIGGGVATIRDYLKARLIDEMHVAVAPILLGSGENLWAGLDVKALGYACTHYTSTPLAAHYILTRS